MPSAARPAPLAAGHRRPSVLTRPGALRVPQVTAIFWIIKALSTAMGESTSDYMVHAMVPQLAVVIGFVLFCAALAVQLRQGRYVAWSYWLAVVMVGIFGTMAADVLHVALGVPYVASTVFYALVLAAVFVTWWKVEGTLSIHTVDTPRRELFYWAAVVATFAMGTALGDLCAYTLGLGYPTSAALFAAVICVPAVGFATLRRHAIFFFWFAYVVTRPLGASIADWLGKPVSVGGAGVGAGVMAAVFGAVIVLLVAFLTVTRADVQAAPTAAAEPA